MKQKGIWCSLTDFYKYGPVYPSFLMLIQKLVFLFVVLLLVSSMFNLITNLMSDDCRKAELYL